MRRIRSESWTFIWQPKVLMQAVLPDPGLPAAGPAAGPAAEGRGLATSGIGFGTRVVSVILFLRFVDPGPHGDLPGSGLEPDVLYLQVPRPRGPPQYIRDAGRFLIAEMEQGPPTPRLLAPPVGRPSIGHGRDGGERRDVPPHDALHGAQR